MSKTGMEAQTLMDFPRLTINKLVNLTLVASQIKKKKSYTEEEHIRDSLLYELFGHINVMILSVFSCNGDIYIQRYIMHRFSTTTLILRKLFIVIFNAK